MNKSSPRFILIFFGFLALAASLKSQSQVDAQQIVKKIDELYRSESSSAVVEMEIITPHWARTLKMNAWSLGMDKTFIRVLEPKKERGIATLRIGNEM